MAAPVLLVHGFGSSAELAWARSGWLDLLADAGRRVIAPDLLGHGNAAKPHDPGAYEELEDGVADAIDGRGVVDAVGFCLGARILLWLEARRPGTFGRIVVAGIGADVFAGPSTDSAARAIETGSDGGDPRLRAYIAAATPPNDPAALVACLRRAAPALGAAELGRVRCPVLVVVGDRDAVAWPPDALVGALGAGKLATVAGADHAGSLRSFGFPDAALDFLDIPAP